jgi:hypothetical protein
MQSEIINLKNKLNQKEEALAEIVDEIVYFENKLKESESNSLELQQCLSTNNKSHCEAIQTLIDYANLLEANCDQPETIRSAKAKTSRILNDVAFEIQRSEQNLDPSLDVTKGWNTGTEYGNNNDSSANSVKIARSGSVFVQHRNGRHGGSNIVTTPREQNDGSEVLSPRNIRVKRSGSVIIDGVGRNDNDVLSNINNNNNTFDSPIGNGQINALRSRIAELENELADTNVKLGRSERNRLNAIRDKDAMAKELEAEQQVRETLGQEKVTITQEVAAAQDDAMNAKRQQESLQRRFDSSESQLREAWEARDKAIAEAQYAVRDMKASQTRESEINRSREKSLAELEQCREEKNKVVNELDLLKRSYDDITRKLEQYITNAHDHKIEVDRVSLERDTARTERDSAIADCDNAKAKATALEREKKYAEDDAQEALRQRDQAQAQAIAAIEEEEQATRAKQAALANNVKAQAAAEAAVKARKEAEFSARQSMMEAEQLRVDVLNEKRQKEAIMREMKNAMTERHKAIVELQQFNKKEDAKGKIIQESRVLHTELSRLKSEADVAARQAQERYENCLKSLNEERERNKALSKNVQVLMSQIKDLSSNASALSDPNGGMMTINSNLVSAEVKKVELKYSNLLKDASDEQTKLRNELNSLHSMHERLTMESIALRHELKSNSENFVRMDKAFYITKQNLELPLPTTSVTDDNKNSSARVHVRRSGSIYINEPNSNTTTYIPSAIQDMQQKALNSRGNELIGESINGKVLHVDRDGRISKVTESPNSNYNITENNNVSMTSTTTTNVRNESTTVIATTPQNLTVLQEQVKRMKDQAALAAQRARDDVQAVELAAATMKAKLKALQDEKIEALDSKMEWEQKFYNSQNEVQRLNVENGIFKKNLETLQKDYALLKTKNTHTENALRDTESKISQFQGTLDRLGREGTMLEERKKAGDDEIERLRIDNQKQLDEKYELLEELRNAQSSLSTGKRTTEKTVEKLKIEISDLNDEITRGKNREKELNTSLNALQAKLDNAESERRRLANEVEGAAAHLRLLGMQKAAVTRELEQVYTSLSELEQQLSQSRNENERLRLRQNVDTLGGIGHSRSPRVKAVASSRDVKKPYNSSGLRNDDFGRKSNPFNQQDFSNVPRATVKISRRGSVEVIQKAHGRSAPTMVPLPGNSDLGDEANAMHISQEYDKGTASTRRGTYYGMYSKPQADSLRRDQRTRSTAEYPVLTPFRS